jgi:hypothetical protein
MSPLTEEPQLEEPVTAQPEMPKFSLEGDDFPLDKLPLDDKKTGIFEYIILAIGIIVFAGLILLLLKG